MARINPQHIEQLMPLIDESPFVKLLGIHMEEMRDNYCRATVPVTHDLLNILGGVHGGAYATMMDVGAFWAVYCTLPDGVGYTTLDLNMDPLRAVNSGVLTIEGSVLKQGGSIAITQAEARDEAGRPIVHAQSKLFISDRLPSTAAALAQAGIAQLPPKFLDD